MTKPPKGDEKKSRQRVSVKLTPDVVRALADERQRWLALVPEEFRAHVSAKLSDSELVMRIIIGKRAPEGGGDE